MRLRYKFELLDHVVEEIFEDGRSFFVQLHKYRNGKRFGAIDVYSEFYDSAMPEREKRYNKQIV